MFTYAKYALKSGLFSYSEKQFSISGRLEFKKILGLCRSKSAVAYQISSKSGDFR